VKESMKAKKKSKDFIKPIKKVHSKPANLLYPIPAVIVSCGILPKEHNLITVAWTGTVCSDPVMISISIRPNRFSYKIIKEAGEFVVNLTNEALLKETDFCGVRSGRDVDKWAVLKLQKASSQNLATPQIAKAPISLECKTKQVLTLGSHDCFIAEVVGVSVQGNLINKNGSFDLEKAKLIAYSHGAYYSLGHKLGSFGFSVKK
jgi:flavin reductase (DIM6/NTAB) family NADH-FMN oxidoreductase RutF